MANLERCKTKAGIAVLDASGHQATDALLAAMLHQALAVGISRGFLVASGIATLALIVVIATIRVKRSDLTGATSAPAPAGEAPRRAPRPELSEAAVIE